LNSPLISVVVPNYNHAAFLEERLDSILGQTYQNIELIVVDDASTDGSPEIYQKYNEHIDTLIINEVNSGTPFKQWKRGIEEAKGEWIWIAESDDYAEPQFLESLLNSSSKAGLRYAQSEDVDAQGKRLLHRLEYTSTFDPNIWEEDFEMDGVEFCKDYLKVKNVIPNASAVIFKKSLAADVPWDEILPMRMCGDWLFWICILEKSSVFFRSETLNHFRNLPSATRMHRGFEKIRQRLLEEGMIRSYLQTLSGIDQKAEKRRLLEKWYGIYRLQAVFDKEFNAINEKGLFGGFKLGFVWFKLVKR
jgi:glycosyltransferase involved in cell wall biosynthesis